MIGTSVQAAGVSRARRLGAAGSRDAEALWAAAQPVLLAQPAAGGGLVESTGAELLSLQEARETDKTKQAAGHTAPATLAASPAA
jgi:hypothetical protein